MINWKGRKVLVTGAGGFIGSHLAERLASLGAKVGALIHYNALGSRGWLTDSPYRNEIDFFFGDITDRDSQRPAFHDVEIVFHLAALIAIPYSYRSPLSYVKTNIEGTLNVLQCCLEHAVSRIICTSTSEVYGTAHFVPITETHPLQGQSPYSASKIGADKIVEAFHASFEAPVVILRPFNTFGPRQSIRAIIPTIITQLLKGDTVRLGNLNTTRDLNFVSNTVDAYIAAASSSEAVGKTIHFGSGREISIGNLAQLLAALMGKDIQIENDKNRFRPDKSEVERLLADPSLATKLLGWKPQVTLEHGLQETIDWFIRNHGKTP